MREKYIPVSQNQKSLHLLSNKLIQTKKRVMKKNVIASLFAAVFALPFLAKADEGMWLPMFLKRLNERDMQAKGLQLTAEELYSINNSSLKDAIVSFGGFCTGEIISDQGLILTNHHCGFDAIQTHSTVDNDYLTDGFWAKNNKEELPNEGLYVDFLVRMQDVTSDVLKDVTADMSEEDRFAAIEGARKTIMDEALEGTNYRAELKSFFEGNEYYLFIYERYNDIRLVGAPPSSIGKYGGDTDNWMWPRHTGDFSMFRVYASPDGSPAEYSEDNVPLQPKHHLPVSLDGVQDGDFTMIWGYPGSTDRYLTSYGIEQALEISNPTTVSIRDKKLATMKDHMDSDPAIRIKYASKYASTANYWKYFIGQSKGLKRLRVYDKKKELEEAFERFVNSSHKNKETYGEALKLIEEAYTATSKTELGDTYLFEAGLQGTDLVLFSFRMQRLLDSYLGEGIFAAQEEKEMMATLSKEEKKAYKEEKKVAAKKEKERLANLSVDERKAEAEAKAERKKALKEAMVDMIDGHFKDYDVATDKDLFIDIFTMYQQNVPEDALPEFFKLIDSKYKGSVKAYAARLYENSPLVSKAAAMEMIENPSAKKLSKDLALITSKAVLDRYFAIGSANAEASSKLEKGNRLFVAGLREMFPDKAFYPNANFTMRMTYGEVGDYVPADAVHYDFDTTIEGILQKMDNKNPEFVVPDRLVELYNKKDYGQYTNAEGKLPVCFISNNDITGGNSGSPVINGKGELIGCAFDGNWEAMSGDIAFEPELQRTISVDIRYVLFIIDKFAGAKHLVDEMTLVKTEKKDVVVAPLAK